MKRIYKLTIIALLVALAAIPARAYAIPKRWRDAPSITQDGATYRYRDGVAVVTKLPNRKEVTVPYSIKAKGKTYAVRAIWDGAIGKKTTSIRLKANLDTCEDGRLWKVKVTCYDKATYKWLKSTGARVTLAK